MRFLIKMVAGAAVLAVLLIIAYTITLRIFPVKYTELIESYAQKYDVEPTLIAAVIRVESGYRESVVSHKDAIGLMQLTEPTLFWLFSKTPEKEDFGAERLVEPEVSINYGTLNLSLLLAKYRSKKEALAAYNAGQTSVDRWLADTQYSADGSELFEIPYPETAGFVRKVLFSKMIYSILFQLK